DSTPATIHSTTVSGPGAAATGIIGSHLGPYSVSPGSYKAWEDGFTTANYDSSIDCGTKGSGTGTSLTFSLDYGDDVTCTITNKRKPTLTVTKLCKPSDDSGAFNLIIDTVTQLANATCDGVATPNNSTGAVVVATGQHTVSESAGTSTDLNNYASVIGGD